MSSPGNPEDFIRRIVGSDSRSTPINGLPFGGTGPDVDDPSHRGPAGDRPKDFLLFSPSYSIDDACTSDERGSSVRSAYERVCNPLGFNSVPHGFSPDKAFAALNQEFPWFEEANALAVSWLAASGDSRRFRLPNIILDGRPGIGKTRWARRVAAMCLSASTHPDDTVGVVSLAGLEQTLNIIGCDQSYIGSKPGLWFDVIARSQSANPIIILDEIDKAKTNVAHALLAYLAPETSSRFFCPFFRTEVDLSKVNYIATTNDQHALPEPFLSRMEVINCPLPSPQEIEQVVPRITAEIIADSGLKEMSFTPDTSAVLKIYNEEESVRAVHREIGRQIRSAIWTPPAFTRTKQNPAGRRIGFCP